MSGWRRWLVVLSCVLALTGWSGSARAAVGLMSFDVEEVEEGIRVIWETGSEVNNLGFNLYRSVTPGSPGALLDFFSASGGVGGAQYAYLDTDVLPDTTYYYTLEALDANGTGQSFGPREITYQPAANATATPTFTFTPLPTLTPTATPTFTPAPTATPMPTITPLPTFTPAWTPTWTPTLAPGATYPPTSTFTPSPTSTPLPTSTNTPLPIQAATPAVAPTTVIAFSESPTAAPLAFTPLSPPSPPLSDAAAATPTAVGASPAPPSAAIARNQPARPLAPTATPSPLLASTRSSDAMLYVAGGFFFGALLLGAASLGIWRAFR